MTPAAQITVRPARSDDAADIARFNAAMALETEDKSLDAATLHAGVDAVFATPAHGFYLVAESDRTTVGCLMVTYEWSDWRNGQWWWLQSVYVDPQFRRFGVFRALYAEVEARIRATPGAIGLRLYVERDNEHAQRAYAALGMHETAYRVYEKTIVSTAAG